MKGIQGLIIAIGLAIAGAIANFAYLNAKSQEVEMIAFVGIKSDVQVARGEKFQESHFVPVNVPKRDVGNLKEFAYLYAERGALVNYAAPWRTLDGGTLLLRSDVKTPPQELDIGAPKVVETGTGKVTIEYRAIGVPIDPSKVVPSLIVPGDLVTFIAPNVSRGPARTAPEPPAATPTDVSKAAPLQPVAASSPLSGGTRMIGPFKVLALGNRLGSPDVLKSARMSQVQENVMLIRVEVHGGEMEPAAQELLRTLDETNSRPLGYMLHPREPKKE